MNKYCIWCDEVITEERKQNKLYCSDKCFGNRHAADNKNEGLGPADYKDHPNAAREQGLPEGGLPWEVQLTLDLEEDSPQIPEDVHYLLNCMTSLPQPQYSDGSRYITKNTKWNFETNGSKVKKNKSNITVPSGE